MKKIRNWLSDCGLAKRDKLREIQRLADEAEIWALIWAKRLEHRRRDLKQAESHDSTH
jgi:hypothetical protein